MTSEIKMNIKQFNYGLIFILFLLKICDIILTYTALGLGAVEMNPFLKDYMDNYLLIVFVAMLAPLVGLLFNLIIKDGLYLKALTVGLTIPIVAGAFVVGWNIGVLLYMLGV